MFLDGLDDLQEILQRVTGDASFLRVQCEPDGALFPTLLVQAILDDRFFELLLYI